MIQVLKVNKQGNKIVSYTCTDGNQTLDISKEQLIEYINKKVVSNAKVQIYQGKPIIRVVDVPRCISKNMYNTPKSNKAVAEEKKTEENQLIQYVNMAKDKGVKELELGQISVDTDTFKIKKIHKPSYEELRASIILEYLLETLDDDREAFRLCHKYLNKGKEKINTTIKPDSSIKVSKNDRWFKDYIKLAERIYQELIHNKTVCKIFNPKNIEVYFYEGESDIGAEELFIHTPDSKKLNISTFKSGEVNIEKDGMLETNIVICYESDIDFCLYLDYNIITNMFSLSNSDEAKIILVDNIQFEENYEKLWLSADEIIEYLKHNLDKKSELLLKMYKNAD